VAGAVTYGQGGGNVSNTNVTSNPIQSQTTIGGGNSNSVSDSSSIAWAEGGRADSDSFSYSEASDSSSLLYYAPSSVSNYENKTPPLTTYPPYLPMWQHGGWGTIQAYFPNGPTAFDKVYERKFDPTNDLDMHEVKGILRSLPYSGAFEAVGGFFNSVRKLFGGPDQFHHGRGFDIANSVIRDRRPDGKPLLVFIDSYVDPELLKNEGYAYVGRISLEGVYKRNWDHVYNAAVAEALPWDVDILLISGGMKGVSVGATTSLGGGGGYSQNNYSLSLLPGMSKGVTEGVGEAVMSATAYRFCPEMLERTSLPESLYDRIRRRPTAAARPVARPVAAAATPRPRTTAAPATAAPQPTEAGAGDIQVSEEDEYVPAPEVNDAQHGIRVRQELLQGVFPPGTSVQNLAVQ